MSDQCKLPKLAEMKTLFGPPPVLRSESQEHYDTLFAQYVALLMPKDIIELTLVEYLVNITWLIKRYTRHQTVAVERWHHQGVEYQVQRIKVQKAQKEALAANLAEKLTQNPTDVAHLLHLESKVLDAASDVDEILNRAPTEREHNRALEKGVAFQEQLDRWVQNAAQRFEDTLQLFEHYREGLGQRLRQVADQILDAEYKEVEHRLEQTTSPSIVPSEEKTEVPSEEKTDDVGTQNNSKPQQ